MSDNLVSRLKDAHANSTQRIVGSNIFDEAATALTEARAEIETLESMLSDMEAVKNIYRAAAESELSTLRARVREVVGPLVDACEADFVGEVCKDEDPNESVALGEDGPSALTFGMIYAARQLNEDLK